MRTGRFGLGGAEDDDRSAAGESGSGESSDAGRPTATASTNGGAAALGAAAKRDSAEGESVDGGSTGGTDAADSELLTDEDRVRRVFRERGGRMKQSDVVEAFGWSKSKTSRVLSRMADDGEVEKLRLGRENVIDLVDADDPVDGEKR